MFSTRCMFFRSLFLCNFSKVTDLLIRNLYPAMLRSFSYCTFQDQLNRFSENDSYSCRYPTKMAFPYFSQCRNALDLLPSFHTSVNSGSATHRIHHMQFMSTSYRFNMLFRISTTSLLFLHVFPAKFLTNIFKPSQQNVLCDHKILPFPLVDLLLKLQCISSVQLLLLSTIIF